MTTDLARIPAPSVALVLDETEPRIVTRDGEVVPLADASTVTVAEFLADLRAMRGMLDDAIAATCGNLAVRSDGAGTRTLRVGGVTVTVGAPTETRFALDAALADLRALLKGRLFAVDLAAAIGDIERVKVTREPDHAAIKRLRAMGDPAVNAILDTHTHTVAAARRSVKVEGA